MSQLEPFLKQLNNNPESISFTETMAAIDNHYEFTPTAFTNGKLQNTAEQNNGSCKIFAFAKAQGLDETQTLACFGDFYRSDVLEHPEASDHQNIRNFIRTGWDGIAFSGEALTPKR